MALSRGDYQSALYIKNRSSSQGLRIPSSLNPVREGMVQVGTATKTVQVENLDSCLPIHSIIHVPLLTKN